MARKLRIEYSGAIYHLINRGYHRELTDDLHRHRFLAINGIRVEETSVIGSAGSGSSFVEWFVSTNVLAKQPRWDGFSTEAPLSIREACSLALPPVREKVPQVQSWSVNSVYLRNLHEGGAKDHMYSYPDIWCYQITFMPRDPEVRERVEKETTGYAMTQIVLFDGNVVQPLVIRKE